MSEQDLGGNAPAPESVIPESADQNQQPQPVEGEVVADESRTSESVAEQESDEQKAARIVAERQVRERRERNKAAAEKRVLENERDTFRRMAETLVSTLQKNQQPPTPPASTTPKAPTRDFNPATGRPYESYEDYVVAAAEYRAERKAAEMFEKQIQQSSERLQRTAQENESRAVADAHAARNSAFAQSVPDFEDVTSREDIEIPAAACEAIKRLQNGPAVLYSIGKEPSIATNLSRMQPMEQMVYIGQLSHWISTQAPQFSNAAPAGRTVSNRPAPSSTPPTDPDAYMAWANKKYGRR